MKPSRIVKSAHARAGTTLTVKQYVQNIIDGKLPSDSRLREACSVWLFNKRAGKSTVAPDHFRPALGRGPTPEQIRDTKIKHGGKVVQ